MSFFFFIYSFDFLYSIILYNPVDPTLPKTQGFFPGGPQMKGLLPFTFDLLIFLARNPPTELWKAVGCGSKELLF